MQNNLYNQINQNSFNIFGNLVNRFNSFMVDFRRDPRFAIQQLLMNTRIPANQYAQGNAEQIVRQMMSNGQISQGQFNQLNNMAVQFKTFLNK